MKKPRQRKPRFQRVSAPQAVRLTERDFQILAAIGEHRFLQSHHITALVPGSAQHLIRRLGRLYHAGWIERPKPQLQISQGVPKTFVYCLTARGQKKLRSRGIPVFPGIPRLRSLGSALSLSHDLLVSEATVCLKTRAIRSNAGFLWHYQSLSPHPKGKPNTFRQLRWSVSVQAPKNSRRTFVIPDAAFALLSSGQTPAWFFLELDRGTMPVTRSDPTQTCFLRKIHAYKETRRSGVLWKQHEISGFRVLVVATGRMRLKSLQTATATTFARGESSMFLFACLNDLIETSDPLGPIWQTCSGNNASLVEP